MFFKIGPSVFVIAVCIHILPTNKSGLTLQNKNFKQKSFLLNVTLQFLHKIIGNILGVKDMYFNHVCRYIYQYTSQQQDVAAFSVNRVRFKAIEYCFNIIGFQPDVSTFVFPFFF